MKKLIEVTYQFEIQIDEKSAIVQEYANMNQLVEDCSSYRFSEVLPVINSGAVKVLDVELMKTQELD